MAVTTMGILATAAILSAVGSTTYQGVQGNQDRQAAKGRANKMETDAQKLANQAQDASDAEAATDAATTTRDNARRRQRAISASAQGERSTILTGPLGLTTQADTARKTLLGL